MAEWHAALAHTVVRWHWVAVPVAIEDATVTAGSHYRLLPFYVQDAIRENGLGGGVDGRIWNEAAARFRGVDGTPQYSAGVYTAGVYAAGGYAAGVYAAGVQTCSAAG